MPPLCFFLFYCRGIKFVQKKKQGYEIWADDSGGEVRRERQSTTIKPENVDQVRYAITLLYIHTLVFSFVRSFIAIMCINYEHYFFYEISIKIIVIGNLHFYIITNYIYLFQ